MIGRVVDLGRRVSAGVARRCSEMRLRLRQSTASRTARQLARRGIPRHEIRGEHVAFVYENAPRLDTAADFAAVDEILPDLPVAVDLESRLWGVIIESRRHPALEPVIANITDVLGIPVQVYHGPGVDEHMTSKRIRRLGADGTVHFTPLRTNCLPASHYNALLLSERFWQSMRGRQKILFFQTDAILCRGSDFHLHDFLQYDYIGSKWPRRRPVGLVVDGGNGGFSLRDWSRCMECLQRFPPAVWGGEEDGYFAFHLDLMGAKVGRTSECARFSTQESFLFRSFGAHKISELDPASLARFLDYCPEAYLILPTGAVDRSIPRPEQRPDRYFRVQES